MKNLLSPHEIATLFVVRNAPGQVAHTDPDALTLQLADLVKLLPAASGHGGLVTTLKGRELLRRLGLTTAKSRRLETSSCEACESY
ncbi:hypothetical protein BZM26_37765 [Paraburkholderia strydomiana]|nr:hypothetical protein BZM26_37765 [Paraburkholderia strydomiana]